MGVPVVFVVPKPIHWDKGKPGNSRKIPVDDALEDPRFFPQTSCEIVDQYDPNGGEELDMSYGQYSWLITINRG